MSVQHKSKLFDKAKAEEATKMLLEAIGYREQTEVDLIGGVETLGHWGRDDNLKETPARVAKYWDIVCNGYDEDPKRHLKLFKSKSQEKVAITNVDLYSFCSHHLALFRGKISISYLPHGKVIGISKLLRISRVFAKRLQLQEDMTNQIASFLEAELSPDVAVDVRASHSCMEIRGVRAPGSVTVTTAVRGKFRTEPALRAEFIQDINEAKK